MKKYLKWGAAAALGTLIVIQFFNPPQVNPAVQSDFIKATHPPPEVATCVRAACYDCHSDETRWPFYARVAPVSWLIASDVVGGREHLNLSEWPADPVKAAKQLDRINEVIDYQEMPLGKYTLIHADARLTAAQRQAVLDWTGAAADRLRGKTNN